MFAPRHTVFIGPGKLPDELRHVVARRAGAPQPDIAIQVPRLLAIFESAADAERLSSQVQRLKLGAAVAGPEQPPAELGWAVAKVLEVTSTGWRLTTTTSEQVTLEPASVTGITLLDWRPDAAAADRAALISVRDARPVMLRASVLDEVSRLSVPLDGIRRINEVLDRLATVLTPDVRVRSRRLAEADFRGPEKELTGDLLPLVLAVVDAVDTLPGQLPQPLQGKPAQAPQMPSHESSLASVGAWVLYLLSLPAIILSLAYFTIAAVTFGILPVLTGLAVGAWATRRFMWSRWLAHANWGERPPVPSWPIAASEPGIRPNWLELVFDLAALGLVGISSLGEGLPRAISLAALAPLLIGVLTSAAAVYEAWQRE